VWDHVPTARELLFARLAEGWRPRESPVAVGPRILGYAACLETGDCGDPRPSDIGWCRSG
jgi:hypothetical protein